MLHEEITGKIIGCSMKVHSVLGPGFQESVYHRSLEIEFLHEKIGFESEKEFDIYYRNQIVGRRRVDFFVAKTVLLEIKAVSVLDEVHLAQALNYLETYKMEIGVLINFGSKSLQFKRLYNNHLIN